MAVGVATQWLHYTYCPMYHVPHTHTLLCIPLLVTSSFITMNSYAYQSCTSPPHPPHPPTTHPVERTLWHPVATQPPYAPGHTNLSAFGPYRRTCRSAPIVCMAYTHLRQPNILPYPHSPTHIGHLQHIHSTLYSYTHPHICAISDIMVTCHVPTYCILAMHRPLFLPAPAICPICPTCTICLPSTNAITLRPTYGTVFGHTYRNQAPLV